MEQKKINDSLNLHKGHNLDDDGLAVWCYTCRRLVEDAEHMKKAIVRFNRLKEHLKGKS